MPRTTLPALLLPVLATTLASVPAAAEERRRPPASAPPAAEAGRGFDWTGAYAGVTAGAASGGGRARPGAATDADRYPPPRTRVRP